MRWRVWKGVCYKENENKLGQDAGGREQNISDPKLQTEKQVLCLLGSLLLALPHLLPSLPSWRELLEGQPGQGQEGRVGEELREGAGIYGGYVVNPKSWDFSSSFCKMGR